jgi:hypothetical protein
VLLHGLLKPTNHYYENEKNNLHYLLPVAAGKSLNQKRYFLTVMQRAATYPLKPLNNSLAACG